MFTSITKELLETEMAECNEICQTLIIDIKAALYLLRKDYEVFLVISVLITLDIATHLSAFK